MTKKQVNKRSDNILSTRKITTYSRIQRYVWIWFGVIDGFFWFIVVFYLLNFLVKQCLFRIHVWIFLNKHTVFLRTNQTVRLLKLMMYTMCFTKQKFLRKIRKYQKDNGLKYFALIQIRCDKRVGKFIRSLHLFTKTYRFRYIKKLVYISSNVVCENDAYIVIILSNWWAKPDWFYFIYRMHVLFSFV